MPGDVVEVSEGVVTGVRSLTQDFILEVKFHPLEDHALAAEKAAWWARTYKVGMTTAQSFCAAAPVLTSLHQVELTEGVLCGALIRQPGEVINLTELVKTAFPTLPATSDPGCLLRKKPGIHRWVR